MAISTWVLVKWAGFALGVAVFSALAVLFVVTRIELHQARMNTERLAGAPAVRVAQR